MSMVKVDAADARWRVLVGEHSHSHVIDVELGGQTYTLPLGVAGELSDRLVSLVAAARTYDATQASQASQAAVAGD